MIADVLVTTDMRGIHSHGVVRLARYLDCIRAGGIQPAAEPVTLSESANSIMASAAGGLGIPASVKIARRLLDKAEKSAIAIATINQSDHYGAAGHYAMMAAERGFVGLSMSNTCPLVAPAGGRAAAIGNNPFAYAAPGARETRFSSAARTSLPRATSATGGTRTPGASGACAHACWRSRLPPPFSPVRWSMSSSQETKRAK